MAMRELIINRLKTIKSDQSNFSLIKWESFYYAGQHISEIDFDKLENVSLLDLFEQVVAKFWTPY